MDSAIHAQLFRFLDLPIELRDDIYQLAIFNLPLPDPLSGLRHILQPSNLPETDFKAGTLHCNILLVNHQVFEEANTNIIRRSQLVNVTVHGGQLCLHVKRALAGSQIVVLPAKYRSFCTLRHEMRDTQSEDRTNEAWEFVLCGRDIDQFCRGLMGHVHYFVSKRLHSATSHTFTFLAPKVDLSTCAPAFLVAAEAQELILEPYRKHLRGFQNVSLGAMLPNKIDNVLGKAIISAIKSEADVDPLKFRDDIIDLAHMAKKLFDEYEFHSAYRLWATSFKTFYSLIHNEFWQKLRRKGGVGYAEHIAELWYRCISGHITATTDIIRSISKAGLESTFRDKSRVIFRGDYKMSLCTAQSLGIPEWRPEPAQEAQLLYKIALGTRLVGSAADHPLGYVVIRRSVELSADDEEIQREWQEYQAYNEWDTFTFDDLMIYMQDEDDSM